MKKWLIITAVTGALLFWGAKVLYIRFGKYKSLHEFNKKKYGQEQLLLLAQYIIQKCVIVVVSSTDEEMAFRIFNVLNDRGKDLTIADILKSEILEKIPEKDQNSYTEKWEECETNLGIDNFKDFFSHLRAIYAKKELKPNDEGMALATCRICPT